ncbi:tRNA lysidine(34) synthetase TilS [Sulfurospirillum sp. 1307]
MQQLPKLSKEIIERLKGHKNLLAYSAGSDSNALFFILKAYEIDFDIALVNYKTREQSDEEEAYAKEIAKKHNKKCYSFTCRLEKNNFEHNARAKRYEFFENIIKTNSYQNLITAHHLNDKFEWLLMQLSKGAGVVELSGMNKIEKRENYTIIRPFLDISKNEIEDFLDKNSIKHFLDSSNHDTKYLRNKIRHEFASSFVKEYKEGLKRSFEYLSQDAKRLMPDLIKKEKDLYILKRYEDDLINIRGIDKIAKNLGVLLSKDMRNEIIRTKDCIISSKIAICYSKDLIYIAPFCKNTMDKKFKEACRLAKIPAKIRPYMYKENITI